MCAQQFVISDEELADDWLNKIATFLSIDGWSDILLYNTEINGIAGLKKDYPKGLSSELDELIEHAMEEIKNNGYPIIHIGNKSSFIMTLNLNEVKKRYQMIVC